MLSYTLNDFSLEAADSQMQLTSKNDGVNSEMPVLLKHLCILIKGNGKYWKSDKNICCIFLIMICGRIGLKGQCS